MKQGRLRGGLWRGDPSPGGSCSATCSQTSYAWGEAGGDGACNSAPQFARSPCSSWLSLAGQALGTPALWMRTRGCRIGFLWSLTALLQLLVCLLSVDSKLLEGWLAPSRCSAPVTVT